MDEPKVIRVTYEEDEAYLLEAFDHMPKDAEAVRKTIVSYGIGLFVGLVLMVLMGFLAYQKGDRQWWLPFVIFGGVCGLVWFTTLRRSARRQAFLKQLRKIFAASSHEAWAIFSESGFLSAGRNGRSAHYPWQSVVKVVIINIGFYVFIDEHTSFWFPRRIFQAPEDYAEVFEFMRRGVSRIVTANGIT